MKWVAYIISSYFLDPTKYLTIYQGTTVLFKQILKLNGPYTVLRFDSPLTLQEVRP